MPDAITAAHTEEDDEPIDIRRIRESVSWWPFGVDATYRLVRKGTLAAIAIGRRRLVTRRLLRECLARNTVAAGSADVNVGGAR